jgi:hypothetical protein
VSGQRDRRRRDLHTVDQRDRVNALDLPRARAQRQTLARRADGAALVRRRHIRSDDPNAGGPIANVTVRDDISVDLALDLPAIDGVSSAAAPPAATRRRRPTARKTPARSHDRAGTAETG